MKDFSQELYRHLCVLIMDSGILTQHYTPVQVSKYPFPSQSSKVELVQLTVVLHCFPLTPLIQLYLALLRELWPSSSVRRDSYHQDPPPVPVLTLNRLILQDSGYPTLLIHNVQVFVSAKLPKHEAAVYASIPVLKLLYMYTQNFSVGFLLSFVPGIFVLQIQMSMSMASQYLHP